MQSQEQEPDMKDTVLVPDGIIRISLRIKNTAFLAESPLMHSIKPGGVSREGITDPNLGFALSPVWRTQRE